MHGPRAQADRTLYKQSIAHLIFTTPNLTIKEATVDNLLLHGDRVSGIITNTGEQINCSKVVLTTGTFLGGVVHMYVRVIAYLYACQWYKQ